MDTGTALLLWKYLNLGIWRSNNRKRFPFPVTLVNLEVLEYFSTSPFYDRQSNNQVLKMQSQFSMLGDLNQRLSSMRGIEFIVYSEHPPDMWIIRKQRRNSPEDGAF